MISTLDNTSMENNLILPFSSKAIIVGVSNWAAIISCLLMCFTWLWLWSRARKHCHANTTPKVWPLLGCAVEALKNLDHLYDWLLIYFSSKTKTLHLPGELRRTYICTVDPELVEYILKTNFSNYPKGKAFHEKMKEVLGDGIFNSDGEIWRSQRKTASFQFSSKLLRDFSTVVFREYALRLAEIVSAASETSETIEMQGLFLSLTLSSIFKVGFGVELGVSDTCLGDNSFARAFDAANVAVARRFLDPFWKVKKLLNIGQEASLKQSIKELDDVAYRVIRTRRFELQSSRISGKPESLRRLDILSRFMELGEADGASEIDDKILRDIVLNFIVAGRDTTAVTLSWFTYMMAIHPDIADKVFEELKQFEEELKNHSMKIGAGKNGQSLGESIQNFAELLNYETLTHLTYLHAVLTETLRLYPAVPADPKGVYADDIAPDGTKLKRGDFVVYLPYCMGRMEFIWGQDARQFKPERWIKDGIFQAVSPFKFTAFQAGPRTCLGKDSAYLQMKITSALLCRFFKFELVPSHQVKYRVSTVLTMAHGLKVTVTRRV